MEEFKKEEGGKRKLLEAERRSVRREMKRKERNFKGRRGVRL